MSHRIQTAIRNIFIILLSFGLVSCITPPTYDGGDWRNFVGINNDLCIARSNEILQDRSPASFPHYFISSRLPYCADGKILMTLQRTDKMRYGRVDTIPEGRKFAKEDILLQKSETIVQDEESWYQNIARHAARNEGRIILYTHGYNETYLETASRIARIQIITEFKGPIIQYSWPSHRKALRYATDATNLELNKGQYTHALYKLAALPEVKSVILISHSLGSQLLLHGLQEIDIYSEKFDTVNYSKKITNVILASPDIDKQIFETIASQYVLTDDKVQNGRRITVYNSARDKAIQLSHVINGYERLGGTRCDDPNAPVDVDLLSLDKKAKPRCYANLPQTMNIERRTGLHIIDTSEVSNSSNGHSDFINSPETCSDFKAVIANNPLSEERRRRIGKDNVWRLNPNVSHSNCMVPKK